MKLGTGRIYKSLNTNLESQFENSNGAEKFKKIHQIDGFL